MILAAWFKLLYGSIIDKLYRISFIGSSLCNAN